MNENANVRIVENSMSKQGWRRVHILSGKDEDLQAVKEKFLVSIPWESADAVYSQKYEEAGIWHCLLLWPVRGVPIKVEWEEKRDCFVPRNDKDRAGHAQPLQGDNGALSLPRDDMVVLWVLYGKTERVSEAVEMAAWRYLAWYGEWPDTAWVGKRLAKYDGREVVVEGELIRLAAADWMPEMGVGVGLKCEGMKNE